MLAIAGQTAEPNRLTLGGGGGILSTRDET